VDVRFFLRQRTEFIRQFYVNGTKEFFETQRKIEANEPPFEPPYSEDGEPPFLEEWQDADDSIQLVGYACVSMLSSALQLLFITWQRNLRLPAATPFKKDFKKGWYNGYGAYFKHHIGIDFSQAPVKHQLIKEIILARNKAQHPTNILFHLVDSPMLNSDDDDLRPHFVEERFRPPEQTSESLWSLAGLKQTLHVSEENLESAILEVEQFADWFEDQITEKIYP